MRTSRSALALLLVVVLLLAACGGDDDDTTQTAATLGNGLASPTAAGAASPTTAQTATSPTAAEPTATPTRPAPTATAAPSPTATEEVATPTPSPSPEPSPTTAASTETDALLAALLTLDSLPDGWDADQPEVVELPEEDGEAICDINEFEQRDARLAEVEVQFDRLPEDEIFLHGVARYDSIDALLAIKFIRDRFFNCSEWQASDGSVATIEVANLPFLTSDDMAVHILLENPEGDRLEAEWIAMRVGSLVATIAYFGPEGWDYQALRSAAADARPRMQVASLVLDREQELADVALAADLAARLLQRTDLTPLGERWLELGADLPQDEDRYSVCDLGLFTEQFGARAEIQNEFVIDRDRGPFFWHGISAFPADGSAADAMAHIREQVACESFDEGDTTWQVLDYPAIDAGDEAHAILLGLEDEQLGTAQGAFVFMRSGDLIGVLIALVTGGELDMAALSEIATQAGEDLERRAP
jgi:hypothetical protein